MTPDTIAKLDPTTADAMRAFEDKVSVRSDFAGLILFGSRARNTYRADSDADIVVLLLGSPGKFIATKLAMDDLAYDVLLDTGIRIQPLQVWESEWNQPETYSNPRLLKTIANEGIRL
jgi:predicted nucleotidyltransferase